MVKILETLVKQGLGDDEFFIDSRLRRVDTRFLYEKIFMRANPTDSISFGEYAKGIACCVSKTRKATDGTLFYTVRYYRILKRHAL